MTPEEATNCLFDAAISGNAQSARDALAAGADPTGKDKWQRTPLHLAAADGHTDVAPLLIDKGTEVNAADNWQQTPLHFAARNGHTKVADLLATAERWHDHVKPLLGPDNKVDATQLVDEAGQPTEALENLLPNDLFAELALPDFYRQGTDGLVLVFPHLPEAVQASIDLTPWRRAKVQEANAAAGSEPSAVERYSRRPRRAPPSDINRG